MNKKTFGKQFAKFYIDRNFKEDIEQKKES